MPAIAPADNASPSPRAKVAVESVDDVKVGSGSVDGGSETSEVINVDAGPGVVEEDPADVLDVDPVSFVDGVGFEIVKPDCTRNALALFVASD